MFSQYCPKTSLFSLRNNSDHPFLFEASSGALSSSSSTYCPRGSSSSVESVFNELPYRLCYLISTKGYEQRQPKDIMLHVRKAGWRARRRLAWKAKNHWLDRDSMDAKPRTLAVELGRKPLLFKFLFWGGFHTRVLYLNNF